MFYLTVYFICNICMYFIFFYIDIFLKYINIYNAYLYKYIKQMNAQDCSSLEVSEGQIIFV